MGLAARFAAALAVIAGVGPVAEGDGCPGVGTIALAVVGRDGLTTGLAAAAAMVAPIGPMIGIFPGFFRLTLAGQIIPVPVVPAGLTAALAVKVSGAGSVD